ATTNTSRSSSLSGALVENDTTFDTEVTMDLSPLTPGVWYRMCVDLDGTATAYSFHDTGLIVYTSPITRINPKVLAVGLNQALEVECSTSSFSGSACSASTMAYLSTWC
ncbi:unnamed protein product, partial [Polarella glacialis]